ncbi:MAG: dodecin domain-containing protein [Acidobacteriia bacterium]|jgi:hypothetical protein|nr:dodecin domain-containing protein [Terriglobia bacterium]
MGDKVFKKVRLVGCSDKSYEKAIEAAAAKAAETIRGASWFEVVELRGALRDGKVAEYQATVDLGFKID